MSLYSHSWWYKIECFTFLVVGQDFRAYSTWVCGGAHLRCWCCPCQAVAMLDKKVFSTGFIAGMSSEHKLISNVPSLHVSSAAHTYIYIITTTDS